LVKKRTKKPSAPQFKALPGTGSGEKKKLPGAQTSSRNFGNTSSNKKLMGKKMDSRNIQINRQI
jgi:hypothetical protein